MPYLRSVEFEHILDHVGVPKWRQKSPFLITMPSKAVWSLATPVRDQEVESAESRFFKSIRDECDDTGKRASLLVMLTGLFHAIGHHDYQAILNGHAGLNVKVAHNFKYREAREKLWEIKYQNKDRLYFFTHSSATVKSSNLLIPLLFHHKKDPTTPEWVKSYSEREMKPFLDPSPKITLVKE